MNLTCPLCKYGPDECFCTPSAVRSYFHSSAPLFDPKRLARNTDPETSHEAARAASRDGSISKAREVALTLVRVHGPATASELADIDQHLDSRHVGRRLPELERIGLVTRGPTRKCLVTGRNAATWSVNPRSDCPPPRA
jgi:hypothetical protein